jgi:hypothetical protein
MDITNFRNKLGAGGARPNQFRVTLTWPAAVGATASDESVLVSAASIPPSNVAGTIVQYRGREVKLAGERTFDPWTVTILNASDMGLRTKFERWSDLMNNREQNTGIIQPSLYFTDLTCEQLSRNDDVIRTYIIRDAFPTNIGEIALRYDQDNVISEFTVTFLYQRFDVAPV